MKTKLNVLKRKLIYLIERICLSEEDYINMKVQSQIYRYMANTISIASNMDYEDVRDGNEALITSVPKSQTITVTVDIWQLLAEMGLPLDKRITKLVITED